MMSNNNIKNTWFKIDYDEDCNCQEQPVLITDKESLKDLVAQVQNIIDCESSKKEFEIEYNNEQDPDNTPFQFVHLRDKVVAERTVDSNGFDWGGLGCAVVVITFILLALFGVYSLFKIT